MAKKPTVNVLLIEDDEEDYIITRDILSDIPTTSYSLQWQSNPNNALTSIRKEKFDVCLLDYNLRGTTALEVLAQFAAKHISVPIIMLTAQQDPDVDRNSMKAGAVDFLVKGQVTPLLLERAIRYAIERSNVQKEREKLLKEKAARREAEIQSDYYKLIAEAIPQMVWTATPDGVVDYFNSRWYDYTPLSEAMKKEQSDWTKIVHPDDVIPSQKAWQKAIKTGELFTVEYRFKTKSQTSYEWFLGIALPIRNRKNHIVKWFGTCTNIHRQKQAEATLRFLDKVNNVLTNSFDYKKNLDEIAHLIPEYMADWCVIDLLDNNTFKRVALVHADSSKKQIVEEILRDYPPDDTAPGGIGKVLRTGKTEYHQKVTKDVVKKTARNIPRLEKLISQLGLASYIVAPMIHNGMIYGAISFVRSDKNHAYTKHDVALVDDLASRIALAVENSQLYEKAQQGIVIRDEFLNIASHELRTPLTSLQLQMQILKNKLKNTSDETLLKTLQLMLEKSDQQTKRLANLINMLLDVSKMNGKKLELEKEPVDLSELTKEIIQRFDTELEKAHSPVTFINGVQAIGEWDRFRIDQVITNILSNAIKYGGGKPITVSITAKEGFGILSIEDKGYGIAPHDTERIFARFERTDAAKKHGGLGLGLYIASEIVKLHGGKIQVTSAIGEGSQFSIILPLTTD